MKYQSTSSTTIQADTIMPWWYLPVEIQAAPNSKLEVVSTPKVTTIALFLTMSIFSQSGLGVCKHFHPGQHCFLSQTWLSHRCSTDFIPDINKHWSV